MRRSRLRAIGRAAQPASWPWVSATARVTPARRSAGVIRPSGAAAPNRTVSQPCSRAMATARRETDGTGSISDVGWRITGKGCLASNSAAPSQAGAYTTTVPGGSRTASPWTNDWIPPLRGGKSLVTISVRRTGRVYRSGIPGGRGQPLSLPLLVLAVAQGPQGQSEREHIGNHLGEQQRDPGRGGLHDQQPRGDLEQVGDAPRRRDDPERTPEPGVLPGTDDLAPFGAVRAEEFDREPVDQGSGG